MEDHNDTEDGPEWPSKREDSKKTETFKRDPQKSSEERLSGDCCVPWSLGDRVLAPLAPTTYVVRSIHSDREKHSKREDEQLWQPNSRHDALRVEHAILSRNFLMLSDTRSPVKKKGF